MIAPKHKIENFFESIKDIKVQKDCLEAIKLALYYRANPEKDPWGNRCWLHLKIASGVTLRHIPDRKVVFRTYYSLICHIAKKWRIEDAIFVMTDRQKYKAGLMKENEKRHYELNCRLKNKAK